jgi:hypothetical protein
MRDGYAEVPVTSRAAQAELERQEARRRATLLTGNPHGSEQVTDAEPSTASASGTGPERALDTPDPAGILT